MGAATEHVTITATALIIETEDSSVGSVVNSATIENTPLNGRLNITGLLALAPGIQNAGSQDGIPAFGVTPAISGASPYGGIDFSIDGATNTTTYLDRRFGEFPPLDGIRKFKVITSGAAAEFGKPAQVILVTKGGTNDLHGTALEYNRNRILAAKNFLATGLPNPQYNAMSLAETFRVRYGFRNCITARIIPSSFSITRAFDGGRLPLGMRTGDFSGVGIIKDPFTGLPFLNNVIPQQRLNPVAVNLQNALYPLPSRPGIGVNLVENPTLIAETRLAYLHVRIFRIPQNQNLDVAGIIPGLGPQNIPGAPQISITNITGVAEQGSRDLDQTISFYHNITKTHGHTTLKPASSISMAIIGTMRPSRRSADRIALTDNTVVRRMRIFYSAIPLRRNCRCLPRLRSTICAGRLEGNP